MVFFTETPAFGGMERHILALMGGLDRDAFEPILYCNLRDETRPFLEEAAARQVDVRVTNQAEGPAIGRRGGGGLAPARRAWRRLPAAGLKRILWFRGRTEAAARLLRGQGIDVIHFHAGNVEAIAPAMIAAARLKIPRRILTMNNSYAFSRKTRGSLVGRLFGRALRSTHAVVAISESVRRCCVEDLGVPADRVSLIRYGLGSRPAASGREIERLRREFGLPPDGLVVGTVARLAPEKALHVLLGAMRWIKGAVPGARCLIVGDGPCRADLERLATRLGLEGAVTFAGARAEGAALIPLFDVAVLPSLREGLSLFLLEAMVAGKPVVASRVGGIPEVVSDGKTGLLVPAGDEARLAAAIIILLRHAYIRRRMGEAARLRMQESFSPEEMLDRVLALYHGAPQGSEVRRAHPGPRPPGRPAPARAADAEAPGVREGVT